MRSSSPRSCRAPRCGSVLLLLSLVLSRGVSKTPQITGAGKTPQITSEYLDRVSNVIENRTEVPYCFTVSTFDITCFWESNTSDVSRFTVSYNPPAKTCNVTMLRTSRESWWYICQFPEEDVSIFGFDPFVIVVQDRHTNTTLYRREFRVEHIVYRDPVEKIKVTEQSYPQGLLITLKGEEKDSILKDNFMYQVHYTSEKEEKSRTFSKNEVNTEGGHVKLFFHNLTRDAEYIIHVRQKPDTPFDGYWSEWPVTTFYMSKGIDETHIILFVFAGIAGLIVVCLLAVFQARFLKRKVWPDIPTPEHHFKELYTTHKGDFKMWLGHTDSYLMWISRNIFHEGPITTLEVLSELPNANPSFMPPVPLLSKDSYVILDENILPQFPAWMIPPRQAGLQRDQSGPADGPPEEKTASREGGLQDTEGSSQASLEVKELTTGEEPPVDNIGVTSLNGLPGCTTILREDSLNSEEGKQSPASSFDYTVLETCDGLLSPRTRSIPPRQPLKYAYLLMSDNGEESPPPSPNIYQNSLCGQFPVPIYSQC
ncbi:erythropoietin receptor [Hyperolius riggenbachi]|uniref:erythropoietin receptor n=1 Tax=Hyperolius riggenbachi TaxID=752182 RepID=UPI0035A39635